MGQTQQEKRLVGSEIRKGTAMQVISEKSWTSTRDANRRSKLATSGWLVALTILKNDGVRQWVQDDNPYMKWKIKAMFETTNQSGLCGFVLFISCNASNKIKQMGYVLGSNPDFGTTNHWVGGPWRSAWRPKAGVVLLTGFPKHGGFLSHGSTQKNPPSYCYTW